MKYSDLSEEAKNILDLIDYTGNDQKTALDALRDGDFLAAHGIDDQASVEEAYNFLRKNAPEKIYIRKTPSGWFRLHSPTGKYPAAGYKQDTTKFKTRKALIEHYEKYGDSFNFVKI